MATKKTATAAALSESEALAMSSHPSSNGQWAFFFSWNTWPVKFVGQGSWPPDPPVD